MTKTDMVDVLKGLCELGMAAGALIAIGEAIESKGRNEGVGLALISLVGRVCCTPFDTPKCDTCGSRTTYASTLGRYLCSLCGTIV